MNKKKFTVIDFLIIVIILAAVIFGIFKTGILDGNKSEDAVVSFDVLISECEDNLMEALSEGDRVSISYKEKDTAVIKAIRSEISKTMTYNAQEGEYYMKPRGKKWDVYVTLEADASQSDTLIEVGSTPLKVGTNIPVKGKGYTASGYIVGVSIDS